MALAVDIIGRHGPSNKMRCELQPKKTIKGMAVLAVYIAAKDILPTLHY